MPFSSPLCRRDVGVSPGILVLQPQIRRMHPANPTAMHRRKIRPRSHPEAAAPPSSTLKRRTDGAGFGAGNDYSPTYSSAQRVEQCRDHRIAAGPTTSTVPTVSRPGTKANPPTSSPVVLLMVGPAQPAGCNSPQRVVLTKDRDRERADDKSARRMQHQSPRHRADRHATKLLTDESIENPPCRTIASVCTSHRGGWSPANHSPTSSGGRR